MAGSKLTIQQVLDLLTTNPQRIAEFTADLTLALLQTATNTGEWSANDVLAHLRSCADMWGKAIETIIAEDKPVIKAINPRTWIDSTDYLQQNFQKSFGAFTKKRTDLLAILESLPKKSWSRSATVTGAGKPLERTVFFYAHWLATHERTHVKQIGRIAADVMRV
ncbi:MAG TPA: DinB family protein [Anaerolineales bacterium]|nr:DinB family protein [Anaerolineales bacterium]